MPQRDRNLKIEFSPALMDQPQESCIDFARKETVFSDEAQAALDMWNGKELDGRRLTVNEARPMAERPPRGGDFDGGGGGGDY